MHVFNTADRPPHLLPSTYPKTFCDPLDMLSTRPKKEVLEDSKSGQCAKHLRVPRSSLQIFLHKINDIALPRLMAESCGPHLHIQTVAAVTSYRKGCRDESYLCQSGAGKSVSTWINATALESSVTSWRRSFKNSWES